MTSSKDHCIAFCGILLLGRGKLDALLIADVLGVYDAECVFLLEPSKQVVIPRVIDLRAHATRQDRNPKELLIRLVPDRGPLFSQ